MRLQWLQPLGDDPGPFATVLMDATSDTADGAEQVRVRWRNARQDLLHQDADEATLGSLDEAVENGTAPDGTAGRVLVASPSGLLVDRFVEIPPEHGLAVRSDVPDLLTIVRSVPEEIPTVTVHVDNEGGQVLGPGQTEPERVDGDPSGPVHKASSAAGGPGERSAEHRVEETWRRNAKAVAERVDKVAGGSGAALVVLSGDGPARSRVRDELSPRTLELVTEVENSGQQLPDDLPATLLRAADDVRARRRDETLSRYAAAAGRSDGFAVDGLADTVAAVRAHAVDTLVLDPDRLPDRGLAVADDPTGIALEADDLAGLGMESTTTVPVGSALIRGVAAADGELVLTGADTGTDVTLTDGVGALLRFPIGPAS